MKWKLTAMVFFLSLTAPAQQVEITVTNPSEVPRINEPVVVPWGEVGGRIGTSSVQLTDDHGQMMAVQIDDLDFDGNPDEVAFAADFKPGETRTFLVSAADRKQTFSSRTDAQNYKRIDGVLKAVDDDDVAGTGRERRAYRFDGVGWESELVGYRLYLDERNATDIQGKRIPGLYWKWIGESGVDYQLDAFWGMDVLHVGPALGIGGIGFWVGDSVQKPLVLDRQRTRIVARGPVRAVVRVEYSGWEAGGDKVDVTSQFVIFAADRVSEHNVVLQKSRFPKTLVTGIVRHDSSTVAWDPKQGALTSTGRQARSGDVLLMAIHAIPSTVSAKKSDTVNDLLLVPLERGKPVRFLIWSYWQGEAGSPWTDREMQEFMASTSRRLGEPLKIRTGSPRKEN